MGTTTKHNHPADFAAVIVSQAKKGIVNRAKSTVETPRQNFQQITGALLLTATVKLRTRIASQQLVERKRKAAHIPLARPNKLAEIVTLFIHKLTYAEISFC